MPRKMAFIVPLENENRWSDLLATMISTDPRAVADILGLGNVLEDEVTVEREVIDHKDRVDLLIRVRGTLQTVVEAKVLSGLGTSQLLRYSTSYPGARNYFLLSPGRLLIDPTSSAGWRALSWEDVLDAFTSSNDAWVKETATDWRDHLESSLPNLGLDTQWNAVPPGEPFALAMRARMAFVYQHLQTEPPISTELVQSGGSKAWVAVITATTSRAGYVLGGELEPTGARNWPLLGPASPLPAVQPMFWVGLRQHSVPDSSAYDWDYLASLWPAMQAARSDWIATRPNVVHPIDKANWKRIGAPNTLGYGFGYRQAVKSGVCMFGARFRLPASSSLETVVYELQRTAELVRRLTEA